MCQKHEAKVSSRLVSELHLEEEIIPAAAYKQKGGEDKAMPMRSACWKPLSIH